LLIPSEYIIEINVYRRSYMFALTLPLKTNGKKDKTIPVTGRGVP
jgi:hypothetical protein